MKKNAERRVWLIQMEWNENTPCVAPNFPKYNVSGYPDITEAQCERLNREMEKYSDFDYCTSDEYEDEKSYKEQIEYLRQKGADIGCE